MEKYGRHERSLNSCYFSVDYFLVWDTIKDKIPEVKFQVSKILEDLEIEDREDDSSSRR